MTISEKEEARRRAAVLVKPFDADVRPGQIRLASSHLVPFAWRPAYFAVIQPADGGHGFVATPYSRFAHPATPGELKTGREHFSLRTLQAWNARHSPSQLLALSWHVDDLDDAEVEDTVDVLRHATLGVPLPERLTVRVGSSAMHSDSRLADYLSEEKGLWDFLSGKAVKLDQWSTMTLDFATDKSKARLCFITEAARRFIPFPLVAADDCHATSSRAIAVTPTQAMQAIQEPDTVRDFASAVTAVVKAVAFAPPVRQSQRPAMQWELPSAFACSAGMSFLGLDADSGVILLSGQVACDSDSLLAVADNYYHWNVTRPIASPSDIILMVCQ